MTARTTILTALSMTAACAGLAQAADYGPLYGGTLLASAPEIRPVEIGTGWYLRGDVGYEFERDYDGAVTFTAPGATASAPFDTLRIGDTFTGGGGIGYRFTEYFRGDLTARYGRHDVSGSLTSLPGDLCAAGFVCDASASGDARTWELMANAYVDLGTFAGFTPYVGGGIGAVKVDYSDFDTTLCATGFGDTDCASASFDGSDSWRFAYQLSAGMAYNINHSLALDVGYRYLNVEGDSIGSASIASGASVGGIDDGYDRHTITAGVRYSLW